MKIIIKPPFLFFGLTTSMLSVLSTVFYFSDLTLWVCTKWKQQADIFDRVCDFFQLGVACYFLYGFLFMPVFYIIINSIANKFLNANEKKESKIKRLFVRSCYYTFVYIISVSIMSLALMILMCLLPLDLMFDDLYHTMKKEYGWYSGGAYDFNPLFADFLIFVHTILPLSICHAISKTLRETLSGDPSPENEQE